MCGIAGHCSDVPAWCSSWNWVEAEVFQASLASSLLHCLWVSAATQSASVKSTAACPRFWWTDGLGQKTSCGTSVLLTSDVPIKVPYFSTSKGSQTDCLRQPPAKILSLHISTAGSCSDSALGGGGRSSTQIASSSLPLVYLVVLGNVLSSASGRPQG